MFIDTQRITPGRSAAVTAAALGGLSASVVLIAGLAVALIEDRGSGGVTSLVLLGAAGAAFAAGHLVARIQRGDESASVPHAPATAEDAATIAHDVRAPLSTVSSYLELLASEGFGPLPPAARDAARRAAIASERVRDVVDSALGAPAGDVERCGEVDSGEVDLTQVTAAALESLAVRVASTGARVTVEELPRMPAFDAGDRTRWLRILQNLIDNALKYHRPGEPPCVSITGTVIEDVLEVTVRDYGTGIPTEAHQRVFARGVRLAGVADLAPGHGVGLATVRRLAAEFGGTVELDPRITDGTAMRVIAPLR